MELNNGLGFKFYVDRQQFEKDLDAVSKKIDSVAETTVSSSAKMADAMDKVGKLMLAQFTLSGVEEFGSKLLKVHGEFQDLETGFRTIIGDAEKAKRLMSDLVETAAITPFEFKDVMEGGKNLLAFGFEVEKVNSELMKLGNISAGLKIPLGDLIYLYGTLKTSGRVTSIDIAQFAGRGIPIYRELAKVLRIAESEVREYASSSKIAFAHVEKAFANMTKDGGVFGGLMEKTSKNWNTKISNISDSITKMFNEIGEKNEDVVTDAIDTLAYLVGHWEDILAVLSEVILMYGVYKAAAVAVVAIQRINNIVLAQAKVEMRLAAMAGQQLSLSQAKAVAWSKLLQINMQKLTTSLKALKTAFVTSIPTAALSAVIYGMYKIVDGIREAGEKSEELRSIWAEYKTGVKDISHNKEIQQLETIKKLISDNKTKENERKELIKELQTEHGIIKKYTERELESNKLITSEIEKQIDLIKQKATAEYYSTKLVETKDRINQISQAYRDKFGDNEFEYQRKNVRTWLNNGGEISNYKTQKTLHTIANIISVGNADNIEYVEYLKIAREIFELDRVIADAENQIEASKRLQLKHSVENEKVEKNSSSYLKEQKKVREELLSSYAELKKLKSDKGDTEDFSKKFKEAVDRYEEAKKKAKEFDIENPFEGSKNNVNEAKKRKEDLERHKIDNTRTSRDLVLEAEVVETEALEDGLEKRLALVELAGLKELNALRDNHEDKLKEYEKYGQNATLLVEEENRLYQMAVSNQYSKIRKEKEKILKEEEEKIKQNFSLFNEELENINKKYDAALELTTDAERIRVIEEKRQEAIEELENTYLEKEEWFGSWINAIADLSIGEIKKQISLVEETLKNSDLSKEENGILNATLRALKKELKDLILLFERTGEARPSKDYKEWEKKAKVLRDVAGALRDVSENSDTLDEIDKKVINFIVNTSAGIITIIDGMKKLSESVKAGISAISMAEKASIILAIASVAIQIHQEFSNLMAGNEKAENEAYETNLKHMRQKIKFQQRLNMLLDEEMRLRFDTILGEDKIAQAVIDFENIYNNEKRFYERMKGLFLEYKKEKEMEMEKLLSKYSNGITLFKIRFDNKPAEIQGDDLRTLLNQMRAKTGGTHFEYTGFLGLKKTVVEEYASLLQLYPDLVDEQGRLNSGKAKELAASGLLVEKDKERLEELIAIREEQEKNLNAVRDFLKRTFGELGTYLSDAIVEAWETGGNEMEIFEKKATNVFKNIGRMIMQQLIIRRWSDPMLDELMSVYDDKKFANLKEEEKSRKIVEEQARIAKKYADEMKNGAKGLHFVFDSFMKSLGQTQDHLNSVFDGTKGIASALTHQDATMLEARANAILQSNIDRYGSLLRIEKEIHDNFLESKKVYMHVEEMRRLGESVVYYLQAGAGHLVNIDRNTSVLPEVRDELKKIRTRLG